MQKPGNNLVNIIQLMSDVEFHDETSIAQQLHITPTTVQTIIKRLKDDGIDILSVKEQGYQLAEPLILLDAHSMTEQLQHQSAQIEVLEQLRSTNDYLKAAVHDHTIKICLAETQTHGRGRFQRHWHSPFGQNLYFSMRYPFQQDISTLAGLNLVVGLSVCKTLETALSESYPVTIKWPNDIIVDNKKIAGSIIDIEAQTHDMCYAIIGIGIDVNMLHDTHHHINSAWTSMRKLSGKYYDRNSLCAKLVDTLCTDIASFKQNGLQHFLKAWKTKDQLYNKTICLQSGQNKYHGKALGINAQGNLRIQLENGKIESFSSGETSVVQ